MKKSSKGLPWEPVPKQLCVSTYVGCTCKVGSSQFRRSQTNEKNYDSVLFNCPDSSVYVDGMPKNVSFIANCAFIIGEIDMITQQ